MLIAVVRYVVEKRDNHIAVLEGMHVAVLDVYVGHVVMMGIVAHTAGVGFLWFLARDHWSV